MKITITIKYENYNNSQASTDENTIDSKNWDKF